MSNLLQNMNFDLESGDEAEPPSVPPRRSRCRWRTSGPNWPTRCRSRRRSARGHGPPGKVMVRTTGHRLQNGKLRGQIDRLDTDPDTHRIRRTWVTGWCWPTTPGLRGGPTTSANTSERACAPTLGRRVRHRPADLGEDGMGPTPAPQRRVYVVPTTGRELLDRLGGWGADRPERAAVRHPDNRAQRTRFRGHLRFLVRGLRGAPDRDGRIHAEQTKRAS